MCNLVVKSVQCMVESAFSSVIVELVAVARRIPVVDNAGD